MSARKDQIWDAVREAAEVSLETKLSVVPGRNLVGQVMAGAVVIVVDKGLFTLVLEFGEVWRELMGMWW